METILYLHGLSISLSEINTIPEQVVEFLKLIANHRDLNIPVSKLVQEDWIMNIVQKVIKSPDCSVSTFYDRIQLVYNEDYEDIFSEVFVQCIEVLYLKQSKHIDSILAYLRQRVPAKVGSFFRTRKRQGYLRLNDRKPNRPVRISEIKGVKDLKLQSIIFNDQIGQLSESGLAEALNMTPRAIRKIKRRHGYATNTKTRKCSNCSPLAEDRGLQKDNCYKQERETRTRQDH